MDHIFELLLEFFSIHAHSIAFPEVALPAVLRVSNSNFVVCAVFDCRKTKVKVIKTANQNKGKYLQVSMRIQSKNNPAP